MVKSDKMQKNSTAIGIYGEFKVKKIRRLIRHAVFFPADFRRTNSGGELGDRWRLSGLYTAGVYIGIRDNTIRDSYKCDNCWVCCARKPDRMPRGPLNLGIISEETCNRFLSLYLNITEFIYAASLSYL